MTGGPSLDNMASPLAGGNVRGFMDAPPKKSSEGLWIGLAVVAGAGILTFHSLHCQVGGEGVVCGSPAADPTPAPVIAKPVRQAPPSRALASPSMRGPSRSAVGGSVPSIGNAPAASPVAAPPSRDAAEISKDR